METESAIAAKKSLNGSLVGGSAIKIGFARAGSIKKSGAVEMQGLADEFPPLRPSSPIANLSTNAPARFEPKYSFGLVEREGTANRLEVAHQHALCSKCDVRISEIALQPCGHEICHECSLKLRRNGDLVIDGESICLVCKSSVSKVQSLANVTIGNFLLIVFR